MSKSNKKRIIFTMGGKGGVGKTTLMTSLVEWYLSKGYPTTVLDLDTENKTKGSLVHFFPEISKKVSIHDGRGLDVLLDHIEQNPIIFADMGASSGQVTHEWFDAMYEAVKDLDVEFIAVGVLTPDPASLESILQWAEKLQHRVKYLVALNSSENQHASFKLWAEESIAAKRFREAFHPEVISMESRIPEIQNSMRTHGLTLQAVSDRKVTHIPELSKVSSVIRVQAYRKRMNSEFDRVQQLFFA